jgi:hypothetical protein
MAEVDPETYVIEQLLKFRQRNDIIMEVCERFSWTWYDAEGLVRRLEIDMSDVIQEKRRPLIGTIGLIILVTGFALAFIVVLLSLMGVDIIRFRYIPIPFISNIVLFVIGVGMMIGGASGLIDVFKKR